MGKFPFKRPRIISKKFPGIDSHIDGVTKSLEGLVFSYAEQVEKALQKKHVMMAVSSMVLLIVLGSFISPKGKAESSIFYPESCLGGWINPDLAEGEQQTTSNGDESQFTGRNSAVLPKNTNAELYCGSFKGTFNAATKPTKIIVSLALTKGSDTLPEGLLYEASSSLIFNTSTSTDILASSTELVASSTEALASSTLLLASSTEVGVGASSTSSSTENGGATLSEVITAPEAETVASSSPTIVEGIVETFKNTLIDLFESSNKTVPETDTVVIPPPVIEPAAESAPTPAPTPAPEPAAAPAVEPTSFLKTVGSEIFSYFISTVFAEEASTTESVTSEEVIQIQSVSLEVSAPVDPLPEVLLSPASSTTLLGELIISTSGTEAVASSTSEEVATTTATSTLEESVTTVPGEGNQFQNNFLEVFYTLDGITWISLGELNEISMKYRTFEIPVTASTSWDDMSHLQMKVVARVNSEATPTVYLDGIKVEVLYDTDVVHVHPDFARDTILKDEIVDGMRIVTIINNDTNTKEVWYMPLEIVHTEVSSSTLSTTTELTLATTTFTLADVSTSTNLIASGTEEGVATTTKIVPLVNLLKNTWKKYEGADLTLSSTELAAEIEKQEEEKKQEEIIIFPDFASDTIKTIKGAFLKAVIVQIEKKTKDELWLYNMEDETKERLLAGSTTSVSPTYPLGVKDDHLFFLSSDEHTVYAYNLITKTLYQEQIKEFDRSRGERAEIHFAEIRWKVIVSSDRFSFFSEETGEVFSDDNLTIVEAFRQKLKLDTVLDIEELGELSLPTEI